MCVAVAGGSSAVGTKDSCRIGTPVGLRRPGSRQSISVFSLDGLHTRDPSPVPSLNSSRGPDDEAVGAKRVRTWVGLRRNAPPKPLDEGELRAKLLLSRVRRALAAKRRNWFSFFASFDSRGDGQLPEQDFEAALLRMGASLSGLEVREVRAYVQGTASCVSIDHFGALLQQAAPPEVSRLESWGRTLLAGLAREAGKTSSGTKDGMGLGAMVRVQGLQSDQGLTLNGLEGMVDRWDSATSRWVVWLNNGELKSLRPENLKMLRASSSPGPAPVGNTAGIASTVAFYKLLCKAGQTAVHEEDFLASIGELAPSFDDAQGRRLALLLPKNSDGLVDVPEVLAQLVASPAGGDASQHSLQPRSISDASTSVGESLPGSVPSPREQKPACSSASAPTFTGPSRAHVQTVLLRLGRRLVGRPPFSGPGVSVLRLFTAGPDAARPEELREAVSVLPLGISSAEMQSVFEHMRDSAGPNAMHYRDGAIPIAQLEYVIEASHTAGLPPEVADLGHLDLAPLITALQKLGSIARGGRVSPSEFRAAVAKAVPGLPPHQLDLLLRLTDKDGDGFFLPLTLIAVLRADTGSMAVAARVAVPELSLPKGSASREPSELLAPAVPRPLVADAILARLRDRLSAAKLHNRLSELLGLFGITGREGTVRRNVLVSALALFRLGISALEADELVCYLCGVKAAAGDMRVSLSDFYAGVQRVGSPEDWLPVWQMRNLARQRLAGRGAALTANATALRRGEWLSERDFRRCLITALSKDGPKVSAGEEDRIVMLAEKNSVGEIRWQRFVQTYASIRVTSQPAKAEDGGKRPSSSKKGIWRYFCRRGGDPQEASV